MIYARNEPYIKRVPTFINRVDGVQSYDHDNLYPQRAEEIKNRSYTLRSAVEKLGEFTSGNGFIDPILKATIFNNQGQTADDILKLISNDHSLFDGAVFHVTYNLNYKINSITPIEFKYARLGIQDDEGFVNNIKFSDNWERDFNKTPNNSINILNYPIFNPLNIEREIKEVGWANHPGQLLYLTPKDAYPLATFDPVFDNAQTQSEIGVYELSNIQEGFVGTTVFKYPGTFKDDTEKIGVENKINRHKGAGGSRIMVAENPDGQANSLFDSVSLPNVDKMFEFTAKNVKNSIRENYSMPAEILGVLPEGGMFNQDQMEQSFKYFNSVTKGRRDILSRVFKKIAKHWYRELPDNFLIDPLKYE